MKTIGWIWLIITIILTFGLAACGSDNAKVEEVVTGPKTYVGSEQCKVCHLEHYDSWKMTLHSRTLQDVTQNQDAVITDLNPEIIRADLKKREKELKVPLDEIYIPKVEDIRFTQGVQWKQRYVVAKNNTLYIAPIEYNAWDHQWTPYREATWDKRPWIENAAAVTPPVLILKKELTLKRAWVVRPATALPPFMLPCPKPPSLINV